MENWRHRFDASILPLRLIDLRTTLASHGGVCFVLPGDWNFHVISHTWSLGIRELSSCIGNLVTRKDGDITQEYNKAFEKADFSGVPCYKHLKIFLRALAADGVEKVWFDALTINQMDNEEKVREICNMGAYYCLSQGCYVSAHGIGEGYKAFKGPQGDVPRWFTRVWTFQECILPRRLTFVVEKFDDETIQALEELKRDDYPRKVLEIFSNYCSRGSPAPCFLRRVENHGGEEELYFLDEDQYTLILLQLKFLRDAQGSATVDETLGTAVSAFDRRTGIGEYDFLSLEAWVDNYSAAREALGGLAGWNQTQQRAIGSCPLFSPECIMEQVMSRKCSVEEDRVLSILALLGLEGNHQLRTGQKLEAQLLALAKHFMENSPNLILNLCLVDSRPNSTLGFSWAPNLRYHGCISEEEAAGEERPFRLSVLSHLQGLLYLKFYAANVVGLSPTGGVKILAKACAGYLVAAGESDGQQDNTAFWIEVGNVCLPAATSRQIYANTVELEFGRLKADQQRADLSPENDAYYNVAKFFRSSDGIVYGCIHLTAEGIGQSLGSRKFYSRTCVCKLWVVLLGYGDDGDGNHAGLVQKLLLCVRDKDDGEMHKIGTLFMLQNHYVNFSSTPFKECFIGGFGMDLGSLLAIGEGLH